MTFSLLLVALGTSQADPCLECHDDRQPGLMAAFQRSAHAAASIGCSACHGVDVAAAHGPEGESRTLVGVAVCGKCHKKQTAEHMQSKHAIGFHSGRGCTRNEPQSSERDETCPECHEPGSQAPHTMKSCARFLRQTPAMRARGCQSCHSVELVCSSCHPAHDTRLALAREPKVCATCHMGPDHPQWEMWETSRHGILYALDPELAPSCQDCHMPEGSHDVSFGIAATASVEGPPPTPFTEARGQMLGVCTTCHSSAMSKRALGDADTIRAEAEKVVADAAGIIRELERERLLFPAPADRPEHPTAGRAAVTGAQIVYEHISRPEAIYFRMKKFYAAMAYKGAYHQNPDYTHWYGNAPLKLAFAELESEAAVLRKIRGLEKQLELLRYRRPESGEVDSLTAKLAELKAAFLRGEIDEEHFERRKNELLDEAGL